MQAAASPAVFGDHLRQWRQRRRLSQLDLALDAEISTRHLSFMETGRASPSREMVLRLAEQLEVPLRERNAMLNAAGFAAVFPERGLADPALEPARRAVELVLKGHEPYPALAVDRHWNMVAANAAILPLLAGAAGRLLEAPVNVLRLSLHPEGLARQIANLGQWRAHLLARLARQRDATADPALDALLKELNAYPTPQERHEDADEFAAVAVPLRLHTPAGLLNLFGTTTVFGAPSDLTLAELALESFFPADEATAQALRALGERRRGGGPDPDADLAVARG